MLAGDLRVDRKHAIALVLEELHHAVGRAVGPVRRADHRDRARAWSEARRCPRRGSAAWSRSFRVAQCVQRPPTVARRSRRRPRPPARPTRPAACPASDASRIASDSGSRPRNGTPISAAAASAPPRPERMRRLAAMRAGVGRHILDDPEHRHAGLVEQVDRAARVDQRQVLRRRDDHRARPAASAGSATAARRRCRAAGRRAAARHRPNRPRSDWPARRSPSARARPAHGRARPAGPSDRNLMPWASTGISLSFFGRRLVVRAEQGRLRGAVNVGVDQADLLAHPRQRDGEIGGDRRLADAALAAADGDQGARGCAAVIAIRASLTPGIASAAARSSRSSASPSVFAKPGRIGDDRRDAAAELARADPLVVRQVGQRVDGMRHRRHIGSARALATVFRRGALPIVGRDEHFSGVGRAASAACSPTPRARGAQAATAAASRRRTTARPRGPWGEPPRRQRRTTIGPAPNVSSLDELLRRGRARFGGGGGGFPGPSRPLADRLGGPRLHPASGWCSPAFHSISPGQRGVVTRFGRYSSTLGPGVSLTLPSPIDRVKKIDVENIRTIDLGSDERRRPDADRRPEPARPRLFGALEHPHAGALSVPDGAARRDHPRSRRKRDARGGQPGHAQRRDGRPPRRDRGAGRRRTCSGSSIPTAPGIQVQGIAIKQADPPDAVNDAFKQVTAAQQDAQILHQQRQCLFAAAAAEGAGRGDRVRQGLRAIQARARSHPPPHVLRDDGAGALQGRQDDRRGAGRHALPAAAAGPEAAAASSRSGSNDRLHPPPPAPRRRSSAFIAAGPAAQQLPDRAGDQAGGRRPLRQAGADPQPLSSRAGRSAPPGAGISGGSRSPSRSCGSTSASRTSTCSASRCSRPTSAGSRSMPSPATGSSIRC